MDEKKQHQNSDEKKEAMTWMEHVRKHREQYGGTYKDALKNCKGWKKEQ
jgi:hypothetical protein